MAKRDFIIISSVDWSVIWQMHHQLATSLTEAGGRVLFVENTGVRKPEVKDVSRIVSRIRNRLRSFHGFSQKAERLFIYSPIFIPFPYSKISNYINVVAISSSLRRWMRLSKLSNPIIITFLPTPLAQGLIETLNPALTIYYCANHMAGASPATAPLRPWEDKLFANADIVFSISEAIRDRAKPFSKSIYSFPAGVDLRELGPEISSFVVPDDTKNLSHPIIGYVGAISDVFDKQLVIDLAQTLPNSTILLVGPKYTDTKALEAQKNIVFLGERSHQQISSYISTFDVGLIPYVVNEFTDSVYSCKLNEYLAMGKPVVSTNMREVRHFVDQFPGSVLIGKDSSDFIWHVKQAISDPQVQSEEQRQLRIAVAMKNTWDLRFSGIMEVIDKHLLLKSQESVSWKDSLAKFYKQSRRRMSIRAGFVLGLYLFMFHTPFAWLVGDQLVVRHEPRPTDAIVVFSGDGESTYLNDSYQRRALDAVHFYKLGYAPRVYISSGKEQTLSEVEIIRLYMVDKGVPESAITILEKYPNSTYQNVQWVAGSLNADGARSILFLTAPYHSRRALWIWKKQAPDIAVFAPAVTDTPRKELRWNTSLRQIKVIAYEYAAIAYDWARGWL